MTVKSTLNAGIKTVKGNPPMLALTLLFVAGVLVASAVYDLQPLDALKAIFRGQNPLDAKYNPLTGSDPGETTTGGKAPTGATRGTGEWIELGIDTHGRRSWQWADLETFSQMKTAYDNSNQKGNAPELQQAEAKIKTQLDAFPKGQNSPPYVWSVNLNKWVMPNQLPSSALFDPSKTPDTVKATPSSSTGGGSDPVIRVA